MHPKKVKKKSLFQHRVIHILSLMFSRLFPDYTVELMYCIFHAILDCFLITVELKYRIFSCYQLEVKPNPHPERPDRLRAIAASLSAAGAYNLLPLLIWLFD
jgi:hypothetical protein